jgi:flagellar hook-associated protein 3 FlgL
MVDGKYIFAGYQENTVPFTKNGNYDPALYNVNDVNTWPYFYNGDHNPTRLEITPGEFIEANLTGNQLFMGITNKIAASGYATTNPYQGETMTSGPIGIGTLGNDITITPVDGLPVTIAGADLTDTNNNYAETVAGLFSALGTGLIATVNAATADLGPLSLTGFNETENDEYSLEISAGGLPVSVTIDGPSGGYDYTLEGLAAALANTPNASNLTPTGGTLSNGVKYDISSGSLLLTGPANGSEIELTEVITDGVVTATAPTGGVGGGTPQTVYGTINVTTNSATSVEISGTGLTSVGLKADTLNGASGRIDLFSVLTRTEEAIRAGNLTEINSRLEDLDIAADQNRGLRSQLGARAKRIDTAILHQQDARVDLKQILSRYQDADIIEVYNDIMQKENAFKAALNVTARVSQISILDYF